VAKLPELMAKISAVWTLMDLKENQAGGESTEKDEYLL
jgi:hypothetical protein